MGRFSRLTEDRLCQSGWFQGRQIDTSDYEHQLVDAGFRSFPKGIEFAREFGDIVYEPGGPDTDQPVLDFGLVVPRGELADFCHALEDKLKIPLLLVGKFSIQGVLIFITPCGLVYLVQDGAISLVGLSIDDAVEAIFRNRPPIVEYDGNSPAVLGSLWAQYLKEAQGENVPFPSGVASLMHPTSLRIIRQSGVQMPSEPIL